MRTEKMERLADRLRAIRFACVRSAIDVVLEDQLERLPVLLGRKVRFGAREIEADLAYDSGSGDDARCALALREGGEAFAYAPR